MLSAYLYFRTGNTLGLLLAAGFILFGIGFLGAKPQIITDTNGIKKKVFGKVGQSFPWDWVHDVRTFRSSDGTFSTVLSYSRDRADRSGGIGWIFKKDPQKGALPLTAHFTNYISLVKEVKEKAVHARFDETTEKIIRDGIRISLGRRIFWIVAVFFFMSVFIYLFVQSQLSS